MFEPRFNERNLRAAIQQAWTDSGKMTRINTAGPAPVEVEVSLHEFTSLVVTYLGLAQRREDYL